MAMRLNTRLVLALNWLSAGSLIAALVLVFLYAPTEAAMGDVQRIFYFHVPSAWVGFLAFFVTLVAGVSYLRSRQRHWDLLGASSAEIGLVFTAMAVITGSLWAKPTWNAWWPWAQEPRLVLVTILLLVYLAYFVLRSFVDEEEQRARFAAVYGILAFASVPFTFLSVRVWQRLHPVVFGQRGASLSPRMLSVFMFCLFAFTVLYLALLALRFRMASLSDQLGDLKRRLYERTGG
jgi:heme exporter protein C